MTVSRTGNFSLGQLATGDGLTLSFRDYPGPGRDLLPVLCLHGLTRSSEDFEDLAPVLSRHRRVLALDVRGRGLSQRDPEFLNYHPGTYAADVLNLLDHLDLRRCIIVGTSMGGLIAFRVAWNNADRLAGMVLNDVGPEIDPRGLQRILEYTGRLPEPDDWVQARANTRVVLGPAQPAALPDDPLWDRLARRSYRELADGRLAPKCDPAVGQALLAGAGAGGPDPWDQFRALADMPVLCLRGASSDILSTATLETMRQIKPDLRVVEIPDRGHAPFLDEPDALQAIESFLEHLP